MNRKVLILIIVALLTILGEKLPLESIPLAIEHSQVATPIQLGEPQTVELKEGFYPVVRTVDGDTLVVRIHNTDEKIRLIGVDTPESVDPRKTVECFGKEASAFTKNLLEGRLVRLEKDPTQGDRDRYQRLLRYVFLEDGTLVNEKIITEGYGHEYTYKTPYHYQTAFKQAQAKARELGRGLWAANACN
jgi:micrococcal nuclease